MDIFTQSFLLVVASEMGDKTQLLALVLASRFRRPLSVMGGILVATLLNHALAAGVGQWIAGWIPHDILRWILAGTFIAFGAWILIPDKQDSVEESKPWGAFLSTLVLFFFAEMGDKTQLATAALGARFQDFVGVTLGTTAGMMVADGLAVFFGDRLTRRVSMTWIRRGACFLFIAFGLALLLYEFE